MTKMRKILALALAALMMVCVLAACGEDSGGGNPAPTAEPTSTPVPTATPVPTPTPEPEEDEEETEPATEEEETDPTEATAPATGGGSSGSDGDVPSAALYAEPENPVPLGEWVSVVAKNYSTEEYENIHIRVTGVTRDQDDIQKMIDDYTGIYIFELTEDQLRDFEWVVASYEIYWPPEWEAASWGITIPSLSMRAQPIDGGSFKTDGGTTYIGVGSTYNLGKSADNGQPGESVELTLIYAMLKNYDESEYQLYYYWYDGEIETENKVDTYFALQ